MPLSSVGRGLRRAALALVAGACACASVPRTPSAATGACALRPDAVLDAAVRLNRGAARWDVASGAPSVWVQPRPAVGAGAAWLGVDFDRAVEGARAAWRGAAPGLALVRAADSASATVRVVWRQTLSRATDRAARTPGAPGAPGAAPAQVAGRTSLWLDAAGRPVSALVELAASAGARRPYAPEDVRVVALHEFGHVLGLAHDPDARSVMAPRPLADAPSRRDRAVLRRLYALPAGRAALRCLTPNAAP